MSMQMLTILQIAYLTAAYLGVMVFIPAAVFYPFFEEKPLAVRFLAYLTIGNFYVMNLVFLLQFLHISNRFTLILGVLIPACAAVAVIHWNSWMKNALTNAGATTYGVMVKTVGMRLILSRLFQAVFSTLWKKWKSLFRVIVKHPIDVAGTILVIVMAFWQYGSNTVTNFGYMASDMPVHNYWINALFDHKPFVAGVYPFGMHTIVYFFSEVFGMEIYNLLRIFGVLQDVLMHISLLIFLRLACKSEFAAYTALTVYLGVQVLNYSAVSRLYFSLPQEYGMIFILPAIAFLFRFFESRREEKGSRGWKLESTKELALFAMDFGMTLAVHFYDTMVAGLFCVAVAIGFAVYIFRKEFLWRILLFGILSIFAAVLPMGIAYVTGTPLEGSLRWGMNVIKTSQPSAATQSTPAPSSPAPSTPAPGSDAGTSSESSAQQSGSSSQGASADQAVPAKEGVAAPTQQPAVVVERKSLGDRLLEKGLAVYKAMNSANNASISVYLGRRVNGIELMMLLALFVIGGFCFVIGERQYGCRMISVALGTFFLCCVMVSKTLGIPALMDQSRCGTYLAYALIAAFGMLLDGGMFLCFGWLPVKFLRKSLAFLCTGLLLFWLLKEFGVREVNLQDGLEKNGSIICVTNILRENKPKTYTIVSANDELRMIERMGYFYEIITLLRNNEGVGKDRYLVIPTPKIYVFIEKIPGEYMSKSEFMGQPVSRESAGRKLPTSGGLGSYTGTNRHIVMSKMYYWAQAFQRMYQNEMSVYYEDEEFICYEIDQNVYRPFDLSIDYGYNNAGLTMPE